MVFKAPKFSQAQQAFHCQFSIEHRSIATGSEINRQALCQNACCSGNRRLVTSSLTSELMKVAKVQVSGFLNRHETRNGNPILVLHAQQLK